MNERGEVEFGDIDLLRQVQDERNTDQGMEGNDSLRAECSDEDVSVAIILTPFEAALGAIILIGVGMAIAIGAMIAGGS